jgi:Ca2+-transporting ATPase
MEVVPMTSAARAALADVEALSHRGAAHAGRGLPSARSARGSPASGDALERDLIFVGTVGIIDPPREEAAPAIDEAIAPASASS